MTAVLVVFYLAITAFFFTAAMKGVLAAYREPLPIPGVKLPWWQDVAGLVLWSLIGLVASLVWPVTALYFATRRKPT